MNIQKKLITYITKAALKSNISKKNIKLIKLSSKSNFGHYQINGIIEISKKINTTIKKTSDSIILYLNSKKIFEKIEYSHPGFINIFLKKQWLSKKIENITYCRRLDIKKKKNKNIIIDYSSPNMAKEMHVGHLRSTILGDVMSRVIEFMGYNVIRINHIGDWGLQFGMMIALLKRKNIVINEKNISLKELEILYQKSKILYEKSENFKKESEKYLTKLNNSHHHYISLWKKIIQTTVIENQKIYKKLNVKLKKKNITGESFYIPMIRNMISDLKKKKIAMENDGKTIIYLDEIKNKKGEKMGVVIQKKNNNFLYSTIDIACLKYRIETLKAKRIIYYTDVRQKQHLKQIQIIAKKAGYIKKKIKIEHHEFGMVLNKKNQPFKTRDGKLIKLKTLIKKSIQKSIKIIKKKNPSFNNKKILYLSKIIGISAIKYADLSKNRKKNYIFDWKNMLSFNGNTALYIQYTYTRIQSIIKKSKYSIRQLNVKCILNTDLEIKLSIKLLQFEEIITSMIKDGKPHILCLYLFQISSLFTTFYEKYPIIYTSTIKTQKSRIKLSFLIGKTIKLGLKILGIPTLKFL
ncbi:arginine--tRNA ligase [Buchnera aphidicola]|uniref:arginine--tRNA ligase n=1 Tax=Buchnera aphidicola TaxID=9 RepID=UPI003463C4A7